MDVPMEYRLSCRKLRIPLQDKVQFIFFRPDDSCADMAWIQELFSGKRKIYWDLLKDLDRKYSFEWNLQEVKKYVMLEHSTFCKTFKRLTGTSFTDYLIRLRLYKIAYLLLNSSMPIELIAYDCGVSTLSNFRKMVRTCYGTSPSGLRNRHQILNRD